MQGGFFDNLVGEWELTGEMGEVPLRQAVTARWTLSGLFLEVYCRSTLPPPAGRPHYEALDLIGFNEAEGCYVMSLFDTHGVALQPVPGIGVREGDSVSFQFQYEQVWTNRFTYHPERDAWTNQITYVKDGEEHSFATKRLSRTAGP